MSWGKIIFRIYVITVCLVFTNGLICQPRWTKVFFENEDAVGNTYINSYDKGILLAGKNGSNYVDYNWLIKTDINGEIIWEKTIGASGTTIKISDMAYNQQGELYLVGLTSYYNENDYDPLIMKLNSCGEKEWCRVFYEEENNFSDAVIATNDGGCVAMLRYMNSDFIHDRICLTKINAIGDIQWKQCYNSLDTNIHNVEAQNLIMTYDHGFLITGYCSYASPEPPHGWWYKPYFIKTDSLGNFEWEKVVYSELTDRGGHAWTSTIDPDSNYIWSSLTQRYYTSGTEFAPALLKMDFNGNIIDIYGLASPNRYGTMIEAKFVTDSTLVASVYSGPEGAHPKAVIIDTLGNILVQKELLQNDRMSMVEVTFDKKVLFFTNMLNSEEEFDAYLFKLNQNLESDTVYTQYFTYDSLCDGEIVSDTIVQDDCGIIVGEVELYKPKEENRLLIYPNPAGERITVACPLFENENCNLEIVDQQGRKITAVKVMKGESEIIIDATGWQPGFYVVRVVSNAEVLSGKVVIHR